MVHVAMGSIYCGNVWCVVILGLCTYLMNFVACTAGLISHVMLSGVKGACQGAYIGSGNLVLVTYAILYIYWSSGEG